MKIKFKKLKPEAQVPSQASSGAACYDLHSLHDAVITEGEEVVISTGLAFEVPKNHVMLIFSRSGHGFKHSTRLANCTGVIDSDYRGEVMVKLKKDWGQLTDPQQPTPNLEIKAGDRVAQFMVLELPFTFLEEVDELSDTERGTGGFGSTGA